MENKLKLEVGKTYLNGFNRKKLIIECVITCVLDHNHEPTGKTFKRFESSKGAVYKEDGTSSLADSDFDLVCEIIEPDWDKLEWLKELKPEVVEKVKANFDTEFYRGDKLTQLYDWEKSKEGCRYWDNINLCFDGVSPKEENPAFLCYDENLVKAKALAEKHGVEFIGYGDGSCRNGSVYDYFYYSYYKTIRPALAGGILSKKNIYFRKPKTSKRVALEKGLKKAKKLVKKIKKELQKLDQ